jgi:hypothetical protein
MSANGPSEKGSEYGRFAVARYFGDPVTTSSP